MNMAFVAPFPISSSKCSPTHAFHSKTSPTCTTSPTKQGHLHRLVDAIVNLEKLTRPPAHDSLPSPRFQRLPPHVKTESQMLGRLSPGCEGTHSVFPKCNFSCTPCYHSSESNKVRVDGMHTITEVARQMDTLRKLRGPVGHCQLIGGEVSLLSAEDHALILETMRFFGRIPMSFTHGDFDYDYLRRLSVLPSGRPRFARIDFAVHFDIGMRGRKGTAPMKSETELTSYRQAFMNMFHRLKKEYGVRSYIAHNMTVQPDNLPSVAAAVKEMMYMGFRLISFQPAALQGARRVATVRDVMADDDGECIWKEIEKGVGIRLPYSLFQMGDVRCNRMTACGVIGSGRSDASRQHAFVLFDDECSEDMKLRDIIMTRVGNIVIPPRILAVKLLRILLRRPWLLLTGMAWMLRIIRRAEGLWNIIGGGGIQTMTIVMHRFMDADDVRSAWDFMENEDRVGVPADEEVVDAAGGRIKETMQRLRACSYGMAHHTSDDGSTRVIPACVQHAVYDPEINAQLAQTLPLSGNARSAKEADLKIV